MRQLSVLKDRLPDWKNLFARDRALLLPMAVVALGIHAAVFALPVPSNETLKTPDDQKNPIKITQIPTEKPAETLSSTGIVIPPLSASSESKEIASSPDSISDNTSDDSSTSDSSTSDSSTSDSSTSESNASAATSSKPASSSAKKVSTSSNGNASTKPEEQDQTPEPDSGSASNETAVAEDTTRDVTAAGNSSLSPTGFADFPQFKPSTGDCFGLGLGDNCRVVEDGAIAEITEYFRKELTAKQFKVNVVADEPVRKVFKVSKENKTRFLTILKGQQNVVYLLSSVIYKRSPEEITEKGN